MNERTGKVGKHTQSVLNAPATSWNGVSLQAMEAWTAWW
jgi:hypothetical protein